ncbi:MAG TPA: response regulator [Bryobacteraceae bacterium]|nr:response regulator [Bryobacteraceae bacterium]
MPSKEKGKTILIVEEEVPDRKSMREALEREGYTVLEAMNYWDALRAYQGHPDRIDMLLTAIALPGNNGYELARALLELNRNLKTLFVSGPTGAEVSRFYNMPVAGRHLLDKPVELADLTRRVNSVFRSRGKKVHVQRAG